MDPGQHRLQFRDRSGRLPHLMKVDVAELRRDDEIVLGRGGDGLGGAELEGVGAGRQALQLRELPVEGALDPGDEVELFAGRLVGIEEQAVAAVPPHRRLLERRGDGRDLAAVDLVGGTDDQRLAGLAEDLRQPEDRDRPGGDDIPEHIAGADRGQLVGVADQQQLATGRHRLQQRGGEADVEHRALVDDKEIGLQGVVLVALEAAVLPLEQAMDSPRLAADDLAHPLRRPAGGGRQQYRQAHRLEQADDDQRGGGLTAAGTTGQHRTALLGDPPHRQGLLVAEGDLPGPAVAVDPVLDPLAIDAAGAHQGEQPPRHRLLIVIQ